MSNISGVRPSGGPFGIEPVGRAASKRAAAPASGAKDTVEISLAAQLASRAQGVETVRTDLVERVRKEIAAGTYDTPERLEATIDRLLPEIFG
jgi:negative regulator of flagellin synthesis FlgM